MHTAPLKSKTICPETLGEIPDAAFIHAARKRRQMARELGGDAPLVETEAPKKRLVGEDQDASDDEDEEEKRIRFSGVKNKSQRQKIAEEIGTIRGWCGHSCIKYLLPFSFACRIQVLRVAMMRHWIQVRMKR